MPTRSRPLPCPSSRLSSSTSTETSPPYLSSPPPTQLPQHLKGRERRVCPEGDQLSPEGYMHDTIIRRGEHKLEGARREREEGLVSPLGWIRRSAHPGGGQRRRVSNTTQRVRSTAFLLLLWRRSDTEFIMTSSQQERPPKWARRRRSSTNAHAASQRLKRQRRERSSTDAFVSTIYNSTRSRVRE